MIKTSTIVYQIHTNNSQTETIKLNSTLDELYYDLDEVYEYLDSISFNVKEDIVQNLIKFAEDYRNSIS